MTESGGPFVEDVLKDATAVRIASVVQEGTGPQLRITAPRDGTPCAPLAMGGREQAAKAIEAAQQGGRAWSQTTVGHRAEVLRRIAAKIRSDSMSGWAELICRETGKRLAEAEAEIGFSALYFDAYADIIDRGIDERHQLIDDAQHLVLGKPIGVVAVLTPWNFPVSIPARKFAPALAAGCSIVFKPSELSPLSGMILSAIVDEYLPTGCVNTVLGTPDEVVDTWLTHPAVKAVSFTGSTRVGRLIAAKAAPVFMRQVLELGGCSPVIVLPDADPRAAAELLMIAKFRNNGQSCIAANQILVPASLERELLDELFALVEQMTIGDPLDPETDLGPLAPAGDPARVAALVNQAVAEGASAYMPHKNSIPPAGHFAAPVVLTDTPVDCEAMSTEVFGPVMPIRSYRTLDDALAIHYRTGYGLAGYVCGQDSDLAMQTARALNAGIVGVNTATPNNPYVPFGGIGISGIGYEGGGRGMEAFVASQTIAAKGV